MTSFQSPSLVTAFHWSRLSAILAHLMNPSTLSNTHFNLSTNKTYIDHCNLFFNDLADELAKHKIDNDLADELAKIGSSFFQFYGQLNMPGHHATCQPHSHNHPQLQTLPSNKLNVLKESLLSGKDPIDLFTPKLTIACPYDDGFIQQERVMTTNVNNAVSRKTWPNFSGLGAL